MTRDTSLTIAARVTIGMPAFNAERHVRRALTSIVAQDIRDLQIVVSDNASTDGTKEVVSELARADARIQLDENDVNIGAYKNFMRLLANAETPYFMWAAADDYWAPTFVSRLVAELDANADIGTAFSAVRLVDDDGNPKGELHFRGREDPSALSHWEMTNALLSKRKYNFWIYGLFRTEVLRDAVRACPEIWAWDRWLVMLVAMRSRLGYVDDVLHVRTIRERRDPHTVLHEFRVWIETPFALARMILTSASIPWGRRLWAPWIAGRYAVVQLRWLTNAAARTAYRAIGSPMRDELRRALRLNSDVTLEGDRGKGEVSAHKGEVKADAQNDPFRRED